MKIELSGTGTNLSFECPENERVLYAGLRDHSELPYECATGTCGSCKAKCLSGDFEWVWADAPARKNLKNPDEFLLCQGIAKSDLKLEVKSKLLKSSIPFQSARWLDGVVQTTSTVAPDILTMQIDLQEQIQFLPGQFMVIEFANISGGRAWSMTNFVINSTNQVDFVIKKKPGGALSDYLFQPQRSSLMQGTKVRAFGPVGKAVFDERIQRDLVCIAGGSGVAGMMSILRAFARQGNEKLKANLYFGVRTQKDAFFIKELSALVKNSTAAIKVVMALSDRPATPDFIEQHPHLEFDQGFVHEVAMRQMDFWKTPNTRAYLAGPPPLVDGALRALLLQAKLPASEILYDKFG